MIITLFNIYSISIMLSVDSDYHILNHAHNHPIIYHPITNSQTIDYIHPNPIQYVTS